MMPNSLNFSLNVVATETLSKTASTATPASSSRSFSGMPSFSYVFKSAGSISPGSFVAFLFGAAK
jgi:hypothetical protein